MGLTRRGASWWRRGRTILGSGIAVLFLVLGSCSDDGPVTEPVPDSSIPPDKGPPPPVVDLRADVNRDGVVTLTGLDDDTGEETWDATHGAVFLANLDDDDKSCPAVKKTTPDDTLAACHDAADTAVDGDSDLLDMARLKTVPWPTCPDDASGSIALSLSSSSTGKAEDVARLFIKRAGAFKLLSAGDKLDAADLRAGVELALEGKDIVRDLDVWDGMLDVTLTVTYTAEGQQSSKTDMVRLRVAPLVTSSHLQPVETLYVSSLVDVDSSRFVSDMGVVLNKAGQAKLSTFATDDQWAQDLFETGWMAMPAAEKKQKVIKVFLRSANVDSKKNLNKPLRKAGRVVYDARGVDVAVVQQYDLNHKLFLDTFNSLGNLETVPPHTHNGVNYPLGRMIMGKTAKYYPNLTFTQLLAAQRVQKPIWIDTSWLLVGHTDETMSFVKAANTRGWLLLLNDPALARKMLQDAVAAGHGAIKMFEGKHWLKNNGSEVSAAISINDVLADTKVMGESATAAVEVASQLAQLKKEVGLTDAEVVRVPFLHHAVDGYSAAFQPGTVNGTSLGPTDFVAPEPHGPLIDGKDIFKEQMTKEFAKHGITVHYVEDWNLYHRLLGEVHCGTNAQRAFPEAIKWWESGL